MEKEELYNACFKPMTEEPTNNAFTVFFSIAKQLSLIADHEEYRIAQQSIYNYAFYGMPFPEVENVLLKSIFISTKPLIDTSLKDRANGSKGGRPKKEDPAEESTEPE